MKPHRRLHMVVPCSPLRSPLRSPRSPAHGGALLASSLQGVPLLLDAVGMLVDVVGMLVDVVGMLVDVVGMLVDVAGRLLRAQLLASSLQGVPLLATAMGHPVLGSFCLLVAA